jgi:hypothetical protein
VEITLSKVDADLAAGDLAMACRRLRGLVASFPDRLDLRERLAHIYRLRGDLTQAGRWSYLASERNAREIEAFEKSTIDPLQRMHVLMWPAEPEDATTPTARQRLAALLDDARARTRDTGLTYAELRSGMPSRARRAVVTDRILIAVVLLVLGPFLIGVIDGIRVLVSLVL